MLPTDLGSYSDVPSPNPAVFIVVVAVWWTLRGFIGWLIARDKERGKAGFWWSFFLGSVGWVIAAMLRPTAEVEARRFNDIRARLNLTVAPGAPVGRVP